MQLGYHRMFALLYGYANRLGKIVPTDLCRYQISIFMYIIFALLLTNCTLRPNLLVTIIRAFSYFANFGGVRPISVALG